MWGNPTLLHQAKSIEKKYWEKINVGTINSENFFHQAKSV